MQKQNPLTSIKVVRDIASVFNPEQISQCLENQIRNETNECGIYGEHIDIVNALARAGTIRQLVENGASLTEATRELGRRMRRITE